MELMGKSQRGKPITLWRTPWEHAWDISLGTIQFSLKLKTDPQSKKNLGSVQPAIGRAHVVIG
jgi:hypothetical protein